MKKKKKSYGCVLILAPLFALAALGASSYLWYKALMPEHPTISFTQPPKLSPDEFSAVLADTLKTSLADFGVEDKSIKSRTPDENDIDASIKTIYTVSIPTNISLTQINYRLSKLAESLGGHVMRGAESADKSSLTLTLGIDDEQTDVIIIRKKSVALARTIKIAVVIDDLGIKDITIAQRLCALDRNITLAILPYQIHTKEIVDLARSKQTPYILHMPMEPKAGDTDPGKGAIFVGDKEVDIVKKFDRAFAEVNGAKGTNNHMGSKATEDQRTMEYVMRYLGRNNYFFLDSQTSRESVGYDISRKAKIPGAKITGYIDAVDDEKEILQRLESLTTYALENGSAIILGHDRPLTVSILERVIPEIEGKGVQFVPLTDLIR